MSIAVLKCDAAASCLVMDWDVTFCICSSDLVSGGVCVPAKSEITGPVINNEIGYSDSFAYSVSPDAVSNEDIEGLQGVYETDCTNVSTSPSTHPAGGPSWSNIGNATQDDGSYASVPCSPTAPTDPSGIDIGASEYIVLTGYGFNIPAGATIVGIVPAMKGSGGLFAQTGSTAESSPAQASIYNCALTLDGEMYYYADPRGDYVASGYQPQSPYPSLVVPGGSGGGVYGPSYGTQYYSQPMLASFPSVTDYVASNCSSPTLGAPLGVQIVPLGAFFTMPQMMSTFLVIFPTSPPQSVFGLPVGWGDFLDGHSIPNGLGSGEPALPGCGTVVNCTPSSGPERTAVLGSVGPAQKDIAIPTLKKTWTAAEVNDPTFGVAISLTSVGLPWTWSGDVNAYLDCIGIAIYYTVPASKRRPNVCVNT